MEKLTKLFEPGKIGTMKVKNRIVMAPLGLPLGSYPGAYPTDKTVAFFEARARGGAGLIQVTVLTSPGIPFGHRVINLMDDERIPSVQRFTRSLKSFGYGVKLSFLVGHQGVRLSEALLRRPPETHPELVPVFAPSAIPHPINGWMPRALDEDGINKMIIEFGQAARRGKLAGFDACLIHGGHGYLIHQFLSPRTNKRTDNYGGSLENRCRFPCEIIKQVRKEIGADFPIIFRMNGDDFLDDGIKLDESIEQARIFVDAGVNAIDISSGPRLSQHWQFVTMYQAPGPLVPSAAAIKKTINVPVIVAGKIGPLLGERALKEGLADFIHMGRSLMVDPELPNKAKEGRLEDVRPCIYCNQCLVWRKVNGDLTRYCTVNPAMGRELEYKIETTGNPKKVVVIGGGLAGMEAARTLAERGHEVSLYEKTDKLGGQWNVLSAYRPELGDLTKYLSRGLDKAGAKVFLKQEITSQMIERTRPDAVVVATGATPAKLNIPGINGKNVVLGVDVLSGKVDAGQEAVVIGGHLVGLDTALFLAEKGKKVSVVEKYKIAWGVVSTFKLALMEKLIKLGVYLYPDSSVESINENGVFIKWDSGAPATSPEERYEVAFLKADTVVLAVGSRSDNKLCEQLKVFIPEVYSVGDCVEPRTALTAIHEGSAIGCKI